MARILTLLLTCLALAACGEAVTPNTKSRILLLGDSMMAANAPTGNTVAQNMEGLMAEEVIDRSVIGARYFYPLPLSGAAGLRMDAQYRPGPWDWVVLNGGGNNLLFGCACAFCDGTLNRLVSADGRKGAIPSYVAKLGTNGARVVYVGYLRNPGTSTPVKSCGPAGNELDRRLALMAKQTPGVDFLPMSGVVPNGDTSFHQIDRIHPSPKGSRAIAQRIVAHIKTAR